mgnify:CR=1 FL=1
MAFNSLQLIAQKWHSGLTDETSLANALMIQPETISPIVAQLFGSYYESYPLQFLTEGTGRSKGIAAREYDWNVIGRLDKPIQVGKTISSGSPGIGRSLFEVEFKDKWFALGDIIVSPNGVQARVQSDPEPGDGVNWKYKLQLADPDPTKFMALADLVEGKKFSKYFSAFEEYSRGGNTTFTTPVKLRNQLTTMRKSYPITGDAASTVMTFQIRNPKTDKVSAFWCDWAEYLCMQQWYEENERSLWYSIYNRDSNGIIHLPGANNRPVYIGAGVHQQIAPSNVRYYTELTETIMKDFLMDLSFNVTAFNGTSRKFVAFAGEYGFEQLDKALRESAQAWNLVDSKFVYGNGQELGLGGQFTQYRGLNGTELTLKHLPLYDNVDKNTKLHPDTKRPLESYNITVLDFAMYDGESNVQMMHKQGDGNDRSMMMWYEAGSTLPKGASEKTLLRSSDVDGYAVHFLAQKGIRIKNPTTCGRLICNAA